MLPSKFISVSIEYFLEDDLLQNLPLHPFNGLFWDNLGQLAPKR